MPTASKTTWSSLKVGVLSLVALFLLGVLVFLLTGQGGLFRSEVPLYTYMNDSAALTKGSGVRLNGILIGEVKDVSLSGSVQPDRVVRITMEVREDMLRNIPTDSTVTLAAENVLGSKFLNIRRGLRGDAIARGGEVRSLPNPSFDEFVASGNNLLVSLQGIITRVDKIVGLVETGQGSIGKFLVDDELYRRVVGTVREVQTLSATLNSDKGTIGKLVQDPALYNDVRASLARVDKLVADLEAGQGTAGKFLKDPALYNEAQSTIAGVRRVVDDLNAGKGTAGKLLKSDELNNEITGLIRRLDNTIDRLNAGEGTIGQLLTNAQLYDSLNGTTAELQGLLKDFRANPKKFLRIKLALF